MKVLHDLITHNLKSQDALKKITDPLSRHFGIDIFGYAYGYRCRGHLGFCFVKAWNSERGNFIKSRSVLFNFSAS